VYSLFGTHNFIGSFSLWKNVKPIEQIPTTSQAIIIVRQGCSATLYPNLEDEWKAKKFIQQIETFGGKVDSINGFM
jgi:AMMECR1 domain-containing protein